KKCGYSLTNPWIKPRVTESKIRENNVYPSTFQVEMIFTLKSNREPITNYTPIKRTEATPNHLEINWWAKSAATLLIQFCTTGFSMPARASSSRVLKSVSQPPLAADT